MIAGGYPDSVVWLLYQELMEGGEKERTIKMIYLITVF